jgi:hypothetical protein
MWAELQITVEMICHQEMSDDRKEVLFIQTNFK